MQRGVTGPLRMVLVYDRRAEQGHDAVTGILIDGTFETVHAFSQDFEDALEDLVPRFGIDLAGQFHGAFHVREEHGDLLALVFSDGLRLQDFVGEMFRGVVARVASWMRNNLHRREGFRTWRYHGIHAERFATHMTKSRCRRRRLGTM